MTTKQRKLSSGTRNNLFAYGLLFPSFIFLSLFTFYPTLKSIQLSFYSGPMTRLQFSGIEQYKGVLEDEIFRKVILNNIIFMIGTVPTSLFL
ncbi:hypothetical protein ACQCVL_31140, partial [Bacillus thuringiensis]